MEIWVTITGIGALMMAQWFRSETLKTYLETHSVQGMIFKVLSVLVLSVGVIGWIYHAGKLFFPDKPQVIVSRKPLASQSVHGPHLIHSIWRNPTRMTYGILPEEEEFSLEIMNTGDVVANDLKIILPPFIFGARNFMGTLGYFDQCEETHKRERVYEFCSVKYLNPRTSIVLYFLGKVKQPFDQNQIDSMIFKPEIEGPGFRSTYLPLKEYRKIQMKMYEGKK